MKVERIEYDEEVGDVLVEIDGTICTFFGPKAEEISQCLIQLIDSQNLKGPTSLQPTG